jgi:hypothetical protein
MSLATVDSVIEDIARFTDDPLGYVLYAFPWGEPGTPLEKWAGPSPLQREVLEFIGVEIAASRFPIQIAISTGHDVGKSALMAMLTKWAMSMVDCRGTITANTDIQLRTKTSVELAKWHRMGIDETWFRKEATSFRSVDKRHNETWRIDLVPWSEASTEGFAGLHNQGLRLFVGFDEGSSIPRSVWDVTQGALTDKDTQIIWLVEGNPTRPDGPFFECFHSQRHRWHTIQADSRNSPFANQEKIADWIQDYGEDSDFVRVRVRGVFPRGGDEQFIPHDLVERARRIPIPAVLRSDPWVCGLDWSLGGGDETVLAPRCGQDARGLPWKKFNEGDEARLVGMVAVALADWEKTGIKFTRIFADAGGLGNPLTQRLGSLGWPVIGVNNGTPAMANTVYHNKGAEMWGAIKAWLSAGGAIPDDETLAGQLTGRRMGKLDLMNRVSIEPKDLMKSRGLESPDRADALALTFAFPVAAALPAAVHAGQSVLATDWDPLKEFRNG